MRPASRALATAALCIGLLAPLLRAGPAEPVAIDDPPPHTCPLCAGDPMLHARRTFALNDLVFGVVARLLRW